MVTKKKGNKDEIYQTPDGVVVVNGQEYIISQTKTKKIDGIEHAGDTIFQKFNRKDFNKKVEFISQKIEDALDKGELVKELVQKKAVNEINKLYDLLKTKKKLIIKKQDGCIGLKIGSGYPKTGGRYIQLID